MKFYIKDFFSKCVQIRSFLRIWSHLMKKKSLTENFIFCGVWFAALIAMIIEVLKEETYSNLSPRNVQQCQKAL